MARFELDSKTKEGIRVPSVAWDTGTDDTISQDMAWAVWARKPSQID